MREQRERDRRLTMRHRWYAGGIATLLSSALIFSGMSPAMAETLPSPTPTDTATAEPTPAATEEATPSPAPEESTAPPAEPSAPPAEESTPPAEPTDPPADDQNVNARLIVPDDGVAPQALVAPACTTNCSTIIRTASISGGGPANVNDWEYRATFGSDWYTLPVSPGIQVTRQAYVISAVSLSASTANYITTVTCNDPGQGVSWDGGTSTLTFSGGTPRTSTCAFTHTYSPPQSATITVKVGSDRTGITGVTNLAGVVLHLQTNTGGGDGAPSGIRADGVAGDGAGWARCVSNATGDCVFTVPATQAGGANNGTRPWVVQYSVPSGYYANPTLRVGDAFGSGSSLAYNFRMKVGLSGTTAYSSQNADQLMLGSGDDGNVSGGIWQQSRTNPALAPSCGLDVALILDISGSVGDALPNLKQAANTFVDSLAGTQSRMSVFSFSWQTPGSGASANYPNLTPVTTGAQGTAFKNLYSSWTSGGGTNWDRGLGIAASSNTASNKYDIAVIITDGNPTTYNQPYQGSGNDNRFRETENGIFSANALKAENTRVIAFGVGAGATGATNSLNLRAISGPTAYNGSNGATADFYQTTDYSAVGTALRNLALGNCAGSLSVTKQIVPNTAPAGSIAGAVPAGAGWQFNSVINTSGVTTPNASQTTIADGTGTVAFPLTFPGGTTTASLTMTENQQSGFTLVPVGGQNAVCTNLNTGAAVVPTGNPTNGFTVNVPSTQAVNCVVYNRAPSPQADVTVTKKWVVNGTPYANGAQPGDISAQLLLTGPGQAGATNQGWGVTRTGYATPGSATISEQVSLIDPTLCTNVATVTNVNGSPANITLGTGYQLSLSQTHNTAEITNTVTCKSTLTLIKQVANGSADPTTWNLKAQNSGSGISGFNGTTGTPAVTNVDVTPDARYQLIESGGSALYAQVDNRTNLQSNPLSTGSATCIRVAANGTPWPGSGFSDGINGGVNVPLGYRVACTLVNQTSQLTLLKHVENDNGGTAVASAWNLTGTPATLTGLSAATVTGSETPVTASTFGVRPNHVYTLTESGVTGYAFVKLQQLIGSDWVDVVANADPTKYPKKDGNGNWQITVDALQSPTYRFVNDDIAPKLTLVKTLTKDNGGNADPTAWTLTASDGATVVLSGPTGSETVTNRPVESNTEYTIGENSGPSGYTWDSLTCTNRQGLTPANNKITLAAGENVTCTLNNNDQPGKLTLFKIVDNANGGNKAPVDWNQKLTAKRGTDATILFDHNQTKDVPAGNYNLAEISQLAGYDWTTLTCSTTGPNGPVTLANPTVTVANGAEVTCSFTNVSQKPTLTLQKQVINDGGGSATANLWTLKATNGQASPINGTGTQVGQNPLLAAISGQVTAGTAYTLTETGPSGYAPQGTWTCVVTGTATPVDFTNGAVKVPFNTNVTCTIINNDTDATGTIAKSAGTPVQQANGTWTIDYTVTVTNNSASASYAYVVNDQFLFGSGITVGTPTVTDHPASGSTLTAGWNGAAQPQLATGTVPAGAGNTHVYKIQVTGITIADGTEATTNGTCKTPDSGGFLNRAQLFKPGSSTPLATAYACKEPAFPVVTKSPGAAPTRNAATGAWTVNYTITLANSSSAASGVDIQASLIDTLPTLPSGWTLVGEWTATKGANTDDPTDAASSTSPWTIWSGTLAKGALFTYTVTGVVQPTAAATPIGASCTGGGLTNKAEAISGLIKVDDDACVGIDTPAVTINKSDAGVVSQLALDKWQIDYAVTVANTSSTGTIYTLTDTPTPGAGWTVVPAESVWVPVSTPNQPSVPAANTPIAGTSSHTFQYRMVVTRNAQVTTPSITCDLTSGGGFFNRATVTFPGTPGTASDTGCATPKSLTVVKSDAVTTQSGSTWVLTYTVTVSNTNTGLSLPYSLSDTPAAVPAGATVTSWTASGPAALNGGTANLNAGFNGGSDKQVATGTLLNNTAHVYTVVAQVTLANNVKPADLVCGQSPTDGKGFWNSATVTNGVIPSTDDGCGQIIPKPVTISKKFESATQETNGTWTVKYTVKVAGPDSGTTTYSLTDTPAFATAQGVTFTGLSWTGQSTGTSATIPATLQSGTSIASGVTHTYNVTATATVAVPAGQTLDPCVPGQSGPFFNSATATYPGGTVSAADCGVPQKPTVLKTANASTQDPATGDWTVSYNVVVQNTTGGPLAYTVTDTPAALPAGVSGGTWTATGPVATGGGTGSLTAGWTGVSPNTQLATGYIPTGATHTYKVSRTVEVAASVSASDLDCKTPGNGIYNTATVTNGVGGNSADACAVITPPTVEVDKTVTSTSQSANGDWVITYNVVVTNQSTTSAAVYDLADDLEFGGDITVKSASWSGPTGTGTFAGPGWSTQLADDRVLAAKVGNAGVDTYTVTATATVPASAYSAVPGTLACKDDERPAAGGFLNIATVTAGGDTSIADDCSSPELPKVTKAGVSAIQDPNDADKWAVTYNVTVTAGKYSTYYDLSDTPAFPVGVTVGAGTAQRTDSDPDGPLVPITSGVKFVDDEPLAGGATHVYQVVWNVTVTDGFKPDTANCTGAPGKGFFNTATLTVGDIPLDGTACIPVQNKVYPEVTKEVTSTTQKTDTGDWVILYDVKVTLAAKGSETNPAGLSAKYDLTDSLDFGGDINIGNASWTSNVAPGGDFNGNNATFATGKTIAAGATHTYTVRVLAAVTQKAVTNGTTKCYPPGEDPSGGFLNTAQLKSGGVTTNVDACSEPAFPTIEKSAFGDAVLDPETGLWRVTYDITVSYPDADSEGPHPAIAYTLTDAPTLPANVTLSGDWTASAVDDSPTPDNPTWNGSGTWTIVKSTLDPDKTDVTEHVFQVTAQVRVTAPPSGEPDTCRELPGIAVFNEATITSGEIVKNDDACQVVHWDDVSIEKSATNLPEGGSVEPGDSFTYELKVTNNGTRPAQNVKVLDDDLNDRLEITDLTVESDPGVSWNPKPGYTGNVVDLTIASIGIDKTVTIKVEVTFTENPVVIKVPSLNADDPAPTPKAPIESLKNTACVSFGPPIEAPSFAALEVAAVAPGVTQKDQNKDNDCDSVEVPVRDISVDVYTRCVNDAPLLGWTVTKSALLKEDDIDFFWVPVAPQPGTTPANVAITQPGGTSTWSDEIEWPGTAFTPSGISIDYPGWRPLRAGDYAPGGGYYIPGTTTVMTPAQEAEQVFNGLILDASELDYSWREDTSVTFSVNPTQEFIVTYPSATPECFVARHTDVQIEKTASVQKTDPGKSFTYDLAVENVSDDSAADGVVVTDAIPADIKITNVTWPGKGDASVFPNWESCEVTGQNGAGYGGTLTCELFGPLQPINSDNGGATAAPTITLAATVSPTTKSSVITNTGVVDYYTFGDPEDTGRDADDAVVTLSGLPATGGTPLYPLVMLGFLALIAGVTTVIVVRRRRGEAKPTL